MRKIILYVLTGSIIAIVAVVVIIIQTIPQETGGYISGGRNVEAYRYIQPEGYPPFPDKTNFIGTLNGDWYQMGKQFGERSGESTRYVSDVWWKTMCEFWGKAETLKAFELYQAQIAIIDPSLVDFMRGISDGASPWLKQSPYADPNHSFHATNYQRVLAVNLWDEWSMQHPGRFPDGSSTFGGSISAPPGTRPAGCSAFAVRGMATMQDQVISAHNRHSEFSPRGYEQVYVIEPPRGNTSWVLTNCPQVAANQVVNDKGVSISLLYGGSTNAGSLNYHGESYYAEDFGVPWFHLLLYVSTYADTAQEAIEILTVGTAEYRSRTGRDTLLRSGGWNFLVADEDTLAVVEATANRYAVRYAGDILPFTGLEWNETSYIVATNHFICDFSYDEHNNQTDVPMTIFGDGYRHDPSTGEVTYPNASALRFWTLMWDMKHNFGKIERYRAQQIMSGVYMYDQDSGERTWGIKESKRDSRTIKTTIPCTIGWGQSFLRGGTCDSKIAVLDKKHITVYWTMGNPIDWQGAWDEYRFNE
jgi:hypothetical protein